MCSFGQVFVRSQVLGPYAKGIDMYLLCTLADSGPRLKAHKVLEHYMKKWVSIDYAFEYSREHRFLTNLMAIIPKLDMHAFADHVYSFDCVAGLDEWSLRLLNRVREDMVEEIDRLEKERIKAEQRKKLEEEMRLGLARPDA